MRSVKCVRAGDVALFVTSQVDVFVTKTMHWALAQEQRVRAAGCAPWQRALATGAKCTSLRALCIARAGSTRAGTRRGRTIMFRGGTQGVKIQKV